MISYKAQRNCKRLSSFTEEKLEEKAEEPVKQEEKESS